MKKPSSKARGKAPRPKFEDNKVDFSKFKMEPVPNSKIKWGPWQSDRTRHYLHRLWR
jgi:hypothetical protein